MPTRSIISLAKVTYNLRLRTTR